jgi:hypothetical protein
MKSRFGLLLGMMLGLSACNWGDGDTSKPKPDINTDTLAYTNKIIKERATDCGTKPDSTCTVVKITYPVFNGQPALNDSISHKLIMLFGGNNPDVKPDTTLKRYAKSFIKGYVTDNPKRYSPDMFYTLDIKATVLRQDSSLTTLELGGYNYQGGAHGGSFTAFINWNTKAGRDITLGDIFTDNYQSKLTAIADTIFRQQEKLTTNASLANDYFFKNNKFALNENFLITPVGLRFLYNQYEIKPYAAGQTELAIPYAKIKTLLRPNTVITQYLK